MDGKRVSIKQSAPPILPFKVGGRYSLRASFLSAILAKFYRASTTTERLAVSTRSGAFSLRG
jgi:hypothetical protein